MMRSNFRWLMALTAAVALSLFAFPAAKPAFSDTGPFNTLLGSWGGTGEYSLADGTRERIKCNAYYTGGGTQLGMAIRCSGGNAKIEIRSKLNNSGGRITGHWEERTFNAEGDASGTATGDRITLQITGAVLGNMLVSYTASSQTVSIATTNIALRSVNITLNRS
ncbi:MAG TPA: hypothetical protein VIG52_11960 [Methyloceanibacter sp.]|jgi:hypothetical protein